jgi:hypothetical protein
VVPKLFTFTFMVARLSSYAAIVYRDGGFGKRERRQEAGNRKQEAGGRGGVGLPPKRAFDKRHIPGII